MANVNTNKKTDVKDVMNKIKIIGEPIDRSDFWFYCEEITDEEGNPTVFHVQEGTGDNLSREDIKDGFIDYIYYDTYDGKITYSMIDAYESGDDIDTLGDMESDGGMVLLYNSYTNLTVQQICWKVLDMSGVESPEDFAVRILSGKWADEKFRAKGKKGVRRDDLSPFHKLLIALWVKKKGDFGSIFHYFGEKTLISQEEIEHLSSMVEEVASKLGGRIVTLIDEDYPDSYLKRKNPPFCYIETDSFRIESPVILLKKK